MIAVIVKPCIVIVLDIPFYCTPCSGALDLYFMFLIILSNAGAISTSAAFLFVKHKHVKLDGTLSVKLFD